MLTRGTRDPDTQVSFAFRQVKCVDLEENHVMRVRRNGSAEKVSELGRYKYLPASENANIHPVWPTDGQSVVFGLFGTGGSFDLYATSADGGIPYPLLEREHGQNPTSASREGRLVAFNERHSESRSETPVSHRTAASWHTYPTRRVATRSTFSRYQAKEAKCRFRRTADGGRADPRTATSSSTDVAQR